jgi:hypothetical protein
VVGHSSRESSRASRRLWSVYSAYADTAFLGSEVKVQIVHVLGSGIFSVTDMLWHEGYHCGQMKLAVKVAGRLVTDEEVGPVTRGVWMARSERRGLVEHCLTFRFATGLSLLARNVRVRVSRQQFGNPLLLFASKRFINRTSSLLGLRIVRAQGRTEKSRRTLAKLKLELYLQARR